MPNNNTIRGVENSYQIVQYILDHHGATAADIAEELSFSRSTVHNHLNTLVELGFLTNSNGEYQIGIKYLTIGGKARDSLELYEQGRETVDSLVAEIGEFAILTTELQGKVITVYSKHGDSGFPMDFYLGICLPLHCTATGKAILANMDEDRVDEIIDRQGLPKYTDHTITSRNKFFDKLIEIRERGIAIDDEERFSGTRGVASPIINRETDTVLGAIAVAGPTRRINGALFSNVIPNLVRRSADMIEVSITYS